MKNWVLVSGLSDVPLEELFPLTVQGSDICLLRSEDAILAFEDRCPHQPIRISEFGCIFNDKIMCNAHGAQFSKVDGDLEQGPALEGLSTIDVMTKDGNIYIDIPSNQGGDE